MLEVITAAIISFIATNIDDILMLTLLFSLARRKSSVFIGQYIGMLVLLLISVIGAYGASALLEEYIWLLGFVPIALGVKAAFCKDDEEERYSASILGIAGITVSNGADNIGVYIPLFAQYDALSIPITIIVYLIAVALLCLIAMNISEIDAIGERIRKYSRVIVPVLFMILGCGIIITLR